MIVDNRSFVISSSYFDVATAATIGAKPQQEDAMISNFALGQSYGYVIVADGMGGHAAGDVASALVASEVYANLKINSDRVNASPDEIPLILREAAQAANGRLKTYSTKEADTTGMGTTLLAPVITGERMYWISVGDSPLLLFRDGALRRLNKDHSMAPEIDLMIKTGLLSEEKGQNHPDRHSLTSVLAGEDINKIDCPPKAIMLKPGDVILASSDGIQFLSNNQIANTLATYGENTAAEIADKFLEALDKLNDPDQDNASFAVIKVTDQFKDASALNTDDMQLLAVAEKEVEAVQDDPTEAAPAEDKAEEKKTGLRGLFNRGSDGNTQAESKEDGEEEDDPNAQYYYYRGQRYKK